MGNVSKEWASLAVLKTILKLSEMCAESKRERARLEHR